MELTVALFSVGSQLVGRVAHADKGARRVVAAVSAVVLLCFTLIDVWYKRQRVKWRKTGSSTVKTHRSLSLLVLHTDGIYMTQTFQNYCAILQLVVSVEMFMSLLVSAFKLNF